MTVLDQNLEPISLRVDEFGRLKVVGTGGGGGGVSDHGDLTGLADDDHPQYLNNARGDARYPLASSLGTASLRDVAATGDASALQVVKGNDSRLADAREWTAPTVTQAEAEAGADTTRKAWTVQRVWQAIAKFLGGVTVSNSPTTGQVLTATGTTAASWQTPSGGGSPGGSSGQVQFNNAGAFGGASGLTTNGTELTVASGTKTTSAPVLDLSQTWNAGGVSFTARRTNITDSASASASLIEDWQVGGVSRMSLRKDGVLTLWGASSTAAYIVSSAQFRTGAIGIGHESMGGNSLAVGNAALSIFHTGIGSNGIVVQQTARIGWAATVAVGSPATSFGSPSVGLVEVNNGTNGQLRDFQARNLIATQVVQTTALTVATLPAAASWPGAEAYVTDANAPAVGSAVASGGSAKVVVRSNGTSWIVTAII